MDDIVDWNTSCGEQIPNGSLVNLNLPNGVLNVHSFELVSSSLICQYPELASRTEKTLALAYGMISPQLLLMESVHV